MQKVEAPIILVTHTKIQIPQPIEKAKSIKRAKPSTKKPRVVVKTEAKSESPKASKTRPKAPAEVVKASKPMPKTTKPETESAGKIAAKNQEAVKAGKVPSRLEVEPGRYDMLLS